MIDKSAAAAEYERRSEILTHGLRHDTWQAIAWALENAGMIGHAKNIRDFLESKEVK